MKSIQIYDTTLRDGAQGEGVSFSLEDKVAIARRLDSLGFDFIEGGYPLSNPKDAEFFQRLVEQPLKNSRVCAFGMTRRRGVEAADDPGMKALLKSEAPVITIVGKTHDFHATAVLGVSLEENLAMIRDTVAYLVGQGREVIYDAEHFFDGWKSNPEYAPQTIQAAAEAGASIIVMCDTNGGSLPEEVADITRQAADAVSIPLGIHTHNDCELAVANSLASIDAGAVHVQGTINGLGERCGNADLISVAAALALKKTGYSILGSDSDDSKAVEHLTELSRYVYEIANMLPRNGQPYVGQSAFAHKGGMHVHAVAKAASSYEHINPAAVGNERRILVSELSGRSNIVALATKMNLAQDKELMAKVLERVVELENQGYQFEAAEASFEILLKKLAGTFKPHFELIKYHTSVERLSSNESANGQPVTEATLKIKIGDEVRHEVAEGDGPVNALDAALRKALANRYPQIKDIHLTDYKVRVINSQAGTAARVRVMIWSSDLKDAWGTIGVSENVIEASWMALVDSVEYMLCRSENT